jgi:GTP-binding protein
MVKSAIKIHNVQHLGIFSPPDHCHLNRIIADADRPHGGRVSVVDTGGLLLEDEDHFVPMIRSQAEEAIRGADAVVLLLDGEAGPIPEDRDLAQYLRALGVPVVPVVNKADRTGVELGAPEFNALGLGEPVPVSAEHGLGIDELWAALEPHLGAAEDADEDLPRTDEVGCRHRSPNVGKSSLLNRLIGVSRVLVSELPGRP